MVRILIADDHPIVRQGLKQILANVRLQRKLRPIKKNNLTSLRELVYDVRVWFAMFLLL